MQFEILVYFTNLDGMDAFMELNQDDFLEWLYATGKDEELATDMDAIKDRAENFCADCIMDTGDYDPDYDFGYDIHWR